MGKISFTNLVPSLLACSAVSQAITNESDLETAYYSAIPDSCIAAADPQRCLESDGYVCNRILSRSIAMAAYRLSCNAQLSNGRAHFAQVLFDGTGWTVETARIYTPETASISEEMNTPRNYLSRHIEDQIGDKSRIGGGSTHDGAGHRMSFQIGLEHRDSSMRLTVVCGILGSPEREEALSNVLKTECEIHAIDTITRLSQSGHESPYRAAGKAEIRWQESHIKLESNDPALIVEAQYQFPEGHVPCRLTSDCCSKAGAAFLGSCREPTDAERTVIDACLAKGLRPKSAEYAECLTANGVAIGCMVRDDGSRLCF